MQFSIASLCVGAATESFEPTWPSLDARKTPQWWRDAKFGLSIHWGVYSVPAYSVPYSQNALGEWYGSYIGENATDRRPAHNAIQDFHDKVYGPTFEYSQFVDQFKAELYEPSDWAKIFKRAGAKWVILTSKHHDGFELWPSAQASSNFPQFGNGWNSEKLGPKRDLLGDLMLSLRDEGLRAGFYHSLFEWYNPLYRGADPKSYVTTKLQPDLRDLVARYKPDDILVDGEWEKDSDFWETKDFLAWLFNDSPVKDTVAVNDRWGSETRGKHGGYYVCENGGYSTFCNASYGGPAHPVSDHPWIYWATTCPQGSWGYSDAEGAGDYQSAEYFVKLLISSVVDGGALMLNLGPTRRGTIPAVQQQILVDIGEWLGVNGEAIYNTTARPASCRREMEPPQKMCSDCKFGFPFAGLNNVWGVVPGTSQKGITYLGKTSHPHACQSACNAIPNHACQSWTWHQPGQTGNYSNMCYGRTDAVWSPVAEGGHITGRRGASVFSSAVQYTQAGSTLYAHFDVWPASGMLSLTHVESPEQVKASLLGLEERPVAVSADPKGGGVTLTLPEVSSDELPCQWSWVVKLEHAMYQ